MIVDGRRNGLALDLRRHAGEVAKLLGRTGDFGPAADEQRFALVQGFQLRQLVDVGFHELCDPPQNAAPLVRGHLAPDTGLEGFPCCLHGPIDVGSGAPGHRAEHGPGGGIDGVDARAGLSFHPLPADQHVLGRSGKKCRGACGLWRDFLHNNVHVVCLLGKAPVFESGSSSAVVHLVIGCVKTRAREPLIQCHRAR